MKELLAGLPPRILVALGATVLAVVVLVGVSVLGGGDEEGTTASTTSSTTTSTAPVALAPPTSIVLRPDWYRKESSVYSERRPEVTVSTVPTTSSTSTSSTSTTSTSTTSPSVATTPKTSPRSGGR